MKRKSKITSIVLLISELHFTADSFVHAVANVGSWLYCAPVNIVTSMVAELDSFSVR